MSNSDKIIDLGELACLYAFIPTRYPNAAPRLHAAGYRRWTNPRGSVRVLRHEPVCGEGPWVPSSLIDVDEARC